MGCSDELCVDPPCISVCIPVFNGERYIRDSIESVLKQTETRFELVVVDNCSTDHTREIVASYSDPRIRVFRNHCNLGLAGNMNKCVELAQGDQIVILPHDDVLLPTMLEACNRILTSDPQIGIVYSSYYRINAEGKLIDLCQTDARDMVMSGDKAFRKIVRGNPIQCAMVRKKAFSAVGAFNLNLLLCADANMWCRIVLAGYSVAYIAAPQNCYRVHPVASTTGNIARKRETGMELFRYLQITFADIPRQSDLHGLRPIAARMPMHIQFVHLAECLAEGDLVAARRNMDILVQIIRWAGGIRVILVLLATLFELVMHVPRRVLRGPQGY